MTHPIKRALALILALLLAIPAFAFAEPLEDDFEIIAFEEEADDVESAEEAAAEVELDLSELEAPEDEEGDVEVEEIADVEESSEEAALVVENPAFVQSVTMEDGMTITVKAAEGVFPDDATLSVTPVEKDLVGEVNGEVAAYYTYDIKVLNAAGDELYQPDDDTLVEIIFNAPEVANDDYQTVVFHVVDEEEEIVDELAVSEDGANASVFSDHFSFYQLVFVVKTPTDPTGVEYTGETINYTMYDEYTYNGAIMLSTILAQAGLTDEVGSLKKYVEGAAAETNGEITVVEVIPEGGAAVMTITPIVDRVGSGKEVTEVYDWAIQPTRELAKNETVTVNVIWHSKTVAGYTLTWPIVFKKAEAYVAETLSNGAVVEKYASLELALTAAAADPTVDTVKLLGGTTNVVKLVEETSNTTSIDIAKSLIIDLSSNSLIINKPLSISNGATVTVVADKASAGIDLASSFATSGGATLMIDDEDVFVSTLNGGTVDYRSGPIVLSAGTYRIVAGHTFPKACVADGKVAALVPEDTEIVGYDDYKVTTKYNISYVINGEPYTLKEANAALGYYNNVNGLDATNASQTAGYVFYPVMDNELPDGEFDGWYTTATWTKDDTPFAGVAAGSKNPTDITLYGKLTPYVAAYGAVGAQATKTTSFVEAAKKAAANDIITLLSQPADDDVFEFAKQYKKLDANGKSVDDGTVKYSLEIAVASGTNSLASKLGLDSRAKVIAFVKNYLTVDEGSYMWSAITPETEGHQYTYGVYQAVASVTVGGETTPYETLYNYTAKVPNSEPVQTTTVYGATVAALGAASTSSDVKFTILNSAVKESVAKDSTGNTIKNPGMLKSQWLVNKSLTLVGIDAKTSAEAAAGSAFTAFLNGNTIKVDLHTTLTVEPAVDSNGNIEYSYINNAIKKGNIVGTVAVTGSASSKLHYGEFTYSWMNLANKEQWVLDNPAVTVYKDYDEANKKYADVDFVGGYPTLEDAIAAASDDYYVVLQQDLVLAKAVTVDKDVFIDLNGKTVSSAAIYTFIIADNAGVTVGNGEVTNSNTSGQSRTFQVLGALNVGLVEYDNNIKLVRHLGAKVTKTGGGYVINVAGGNLFVFSDPETKYDEEDDPIEPTADQFVVVSGTLGGVTKDNTTVLGGYFTDKTSILAPVSSIGFSIYNEAPAGETGTNWWHVKQSVAYNVNTEVYYATLADAVANVAANQIIRLVNDAKVTEAIPVTKSFTLNLGGFDAYNYGGTVFTVAEGAKLTINGGTAITPTASAAPTAKSGTLKAGRILGGIVAAGSVDVNNAVVANISRTAKSDGSYSDLGTAIEFNGITTASTATTSTLKLTNTYVFGKNGVVVTGGKVAGWSGAYVATSDTAMIVDATAPASAINVTLPAGNTFASSKGLAFEEKDNGTALPTILITGGTFTSDVKDETSTEEVKPLIVPVSFTDAFLAKVNWKDTTVTAAVTDGISGGSYSQFIPDEYCTVTTACSATAENDLYEVKSNVKFVNYYRSYTKGSGDKTTDTFVLIKTDKVVSGEATKTSEVPENPTENNKAFRYWFAFTRDQLPIPATTVPTQYNTASAVSANVDLLPYFDSWTAYITTAEGETLYFYDQNAAFEKWYDLNWTTAIVDGETKTTFNPGNDLFIKYEKKTGNVVNKTYLVKLDGIANTFVKGQASNVIKAAKDALDVLYNKDTIANADSVSFEVAVTANNDIYTASVEAVPCLNGAQVYNRYAMTPANDAFVPVAEYDFEITAPEAYASLASIAVVQYSNSGATTLEETYSNQAISDGKVLATGIKNLNNRYFRLSNVVANVVVTGGNASQGAGTFTYESLDEAVKKALTTSQTYTQYYQTYTHTITINLLSDIALTAPQAIDFTATTVLASDVTLNLNGFTVSNDPAANAALSSILNVTGASGKTLTITDTEKGAIVNTTGAALNANASTTVAISAGAFTGTTAAITSAGTVTISGGSYKATTGTSDLSGTGIKASAGIFAHTVADSYCATNYKTTANTNKETKEEYPYTLVSGAVAEYDGLYYADLADAVAAVPANGTGTVNLIADSTDSGTKKHVVIPAGSNITIDLKGNSVRYTVKAETVTLPDKTTKSVVFPAITVEGTLTLMDSGKGSGMIKDYGTYTVEATGNETTPAIKVEKGGSLTLDANFTSTGYYAIESEGTVVVPNNEVQEFSISGTTAALVMDNSKGGAAATIEGAIFRANEQYKPVLSVAYMLDNEGDPITSEPNKDAILKGFVSGGKFSAKIDKKLLATGKVMSDTTLPGGLYFVADGVTVTLNSGNEKVKFTDYDEDGNPLATQVTTLVLTGAKGTKLNELLHYPANELKLDKHTFDGWLDANGNKVAVNAAINESVELTAQWSGQLFDVKLIYGTVVDGDPVEGDPVTSGNTQTQTRTQTRTTTKVEIADSTVLAPYTAYLKDQYNIVRTVDTANMTITFSGVPYGMKVDELVLTKAKTVQGADGKDVTYGPEILGTKSVSTQTRTSSRTRTRRSQYSQWRSWSEYSAWSDWSTPTIDPPISGAVIWKSNNKTQTAVDDTWTLDESTTPKYIVGTADIETGANKTITLYNGYTVMGTAASIAYGTALTKAQTKDYLDGMLKAGAGAATVEDAVKALNLTKNKQDGERKAIHADDAYTPAADSLVMTENQIYALKWVDQVYVTFHFNKVDGTAATEVVNVDKGATYSKIVAPDLDPAAGTTVQWMTAQTGGSVVDLTSTTQIITADMDLWASVTTTKNMTYNAPATQTVDYTGSQASAVVTVSDPTNAKIEYSTDGGVNWASTNKVGPASGTYTVNYRLTAPGYNTVTGSIALTIDKQKWDVTFNTDGGTAIAAQKVKDGETATKPADPTKEGYNFVKWVDKDGAEFVFTTPIHAATVITAIWQQKQAWTLTFMDGETEFMKQTVFDGELPLAPESPTKEFYVFDKWVDAEGNAFDATKPVTADATYVATWTDTIFLTGSIDLQSSIGLNAYVHLPDGENPADYTAKYSYKSYIQEVPETEYTFEGKTTRDRQRGDEKVPCYLIKLAELGSDEMVDEATLIVYKKGEKVAEKKYSIRNYVAEQLAAGGLDPDLEKLFRSVLQYGHYAQIQFKNHTDDLPSTEGAPALVPIPSSYAVSGDPTLASVKEFSASLALDTSVDMTVYITPADGYELKDFTISVKDKDGKDYTKFTEPKIRKGAVYFKIQGIYSDQMSDQFTITVTDKDGKSASWVRSLMNCAYNKEQTSTEKNMKDLMEALYQFHMAAKTWFA